MRQRNYGPLNYDMTHVLAVNYTYNLPNWAKRWRNPVLNQIFGGWQVSGITSMASGTPFTVGYSTTDGTDMLGSNDSQRVTVLMDPKLPKSERTFARNFKTEAFARTPRLDFGNLGLNSMRGPGTNNWDISVSKRINFGETRYFQFRSEFYNAFNHTQFSSYDTGARFDPQGRQVNNNFGAYNGARDPRRIQFSLRFMF